jgi:hypothetical protein
MRDVTITRDQSRDTGMAMVLLLLLALLKSNPPSGGLAPTIVSTFAPEVRLAER